MNLSLVLPIVATSLVAQNAPAALQLQQAPSPGVEKSFAPLPVKNGVPTATDVVVPAEAIPMPRHGTTADADTVLAAATRVFEDPDFVAIDDGDAATIWVAGGNYKAAFGADGWSFIGRPQTGATTLQPIDFRLQSVRVGERSLALHGAARSRADHRIEYDHGSVREALDVTGRGVEQTFVFDRLPQRGELVIDVAVQTALAVGSSADGVTFTGEFDHVGYSPAIAIDAAGNRIDAPTALVDGRLSIRVPAEFVAHATLPLLVDPWVTAAPVYNSTNDVGEPDIAYDETGQVWAVTFMRYFGGSDWDCYVQRLSLGNPMTPVGGLTTIDASAMAWVQPRIANLGVFDGFMVVCQVKNGTFPWNISGRIMANSGPTITNQFVIASSGVDELHPDIGGDVGAPPGFFTVVWEHAFSATDHDIYARQVDISGVLQGTNPIFVQTDTANQTRPSIVKSAGGGLAASTRFAIVYQQTFSSIDEDIYGAMLTRGGQPVLVGASLNFPVSLSGNNEVFPQVSSPTLPDFTGNRLMLAVFEQTNVNNGDIVAACFDLDGTLRGLANVNTLEQDPNRQSWPQHHACVDTDGRRFVVGYHEQFNNNPTVNDLDTRVSVVALAGTELFIEEPATPLGFSNTAREFNMQIASRYSGTGTLSPNFNTTHDRDGIAGGFGIDAYSFDLLPVGRVATRATACGTIAIHTSGQPLPGGVLNLTLTAPAIAGFVLGSAIDLPVGPCPGCTLGVDGFLSVGASYVLLVPSNPAIVGAQFSAQGFTFQPSGAPCLGQIQLSDTLDFTIG